MAAVTPPVKSRRNRFAPRETSLLELFDLVGRYRAMSTPHLHELFLHGEPTLRATQRRVARLVENGFLQTLTIPARPPLRMSYLAAGAFSQCSELHHLFGPTSRAEPTPDIALHAWTRAALALAATKAGFTVGRDLAALTALRRFLIDGQRARIARAGSSAVLAAEQVLAQLRALPLLQPWFIARCERCAEALALNVRPTGPCEHCGGAMVSDVVPVPYACSVCGLQAAHAGAHGGSLGPCTGVLRRVDHLPFDLAWRRTGTGYDVQVLLADNPYRSVAAQLAELPLRVIGQPLVPIVLRASDDGTIFDLATRTYAVQGPRFRALQRAFVESNARDDAFPFWTTGTVLPDAYGPEAHFRVLHAPKDKKP